MSGALAVYDDNGELCIYDMPVYERNKTKRVDVAALAGIIKNETIDYAVIEQVNAFGMGASSAYNFGWSCGVVEGVLGALKVPFYYVTPQVWKKALQCPKEKDSARARASQLFPDQKENWWPLKKHDGRAEAAMIALYGIKNF